MVEAAGDGHIHHDRAVTFAEVGRGTNPDIDRPKPGSRVAPVVCLLSLKVYDLQKSKGLPSRSAISCARHINERWSSSSQFQSSFASDAITCGSESQYRSMATSDGAA